MRRPSRREWLLLGCVPVLILVSAGVERNSIDSAATIVEAMPAVKSAVRPAVRVADPKELDLAPLRREAAMVDPGNAFTSKSWYVPPPPPPPPPPVKVAPPPAPTAPPLPFTYLGRYVDAGRPVFFLLRGDIILTVKQGDIVDGSYRIDGIDGSRLGLTYLPLDIKQTLDVGNQG